MDRVLARLREPSSMGGIGLVITGVHSLVGGDLTTGVGQILAGVAAILLAERGGRP